MKNRITALTILAAALAGCSVAPRGPVADHTAARPADSGHASASSRLARPESSSARSLDAYKHELAQRISQVNAGGVFAGRPQAMLRSVVVVRFGIDARGNLLRSEILRSNHDRAAESIAIAALRSAAPFPRPPAHLVRQGKVDIIETWLFNSDGRFQLRTIAEPQMEQ